MPETTVLTPDRWQPLRQRHHERVTALLGPYLELRARGEAHPVVDFLFTYYRLTPAQLLRWHPGFGVTLTEADDYAGLRGYHRTRAGVTADPGFLLRRRDTVGYVADLLAATAARKPQLGCFGLHEWAMVYRADAVRHSVVPLRLGRAGTDAVVESMPLRCTHYDAFRFFTPSAAPRNAATLTRRTQIDHEQPGCLHAGMDLYRFATKLVPLIDSDLLWRAFTLAYRARELDMQASPYDLTDYGYPPVAIETAQGRAEYARRQAELADDGRSVRAGLEARCRWLLTQPACPSPAK
jgi:hypothetical protein